MTVRAVILGLLAAIFIATVGYWNDQVPRTAYFVGNHFPIIVFGPLVLIAVFFRPLARRLGLGRATAGRELAVVVALALIACNIPGSGLLRFFSRNLAMPPVLRKDNPTWERARAFDYAPTRLLANDGRFDPAVHETFLNGLRQPSGNIGFKQVPWEAWRTSLETWLPLVGLMGVASICLALLVHRTWSTRERLPYPIAQFANTLLDDASTGQGPPLLRLRGFWVAALSVLGIHVVNGLNGYLDNKSITIPLSFDISPLLGIFPSVSWGPYANAALANIQIWPTVFAFVFFIASDVALAMGLAPIALTVLTTVLVGVGASTVGDTMNGGYLQWQQAGSYLALAAMILYLGRRSYAHTFRAAFFPRAASDAKPYEAWACRILLLALPALVLFLANLGLAWTLAVVLVLLLLVSQLVMARVNAEAGVFLSQAAWQPIAVMIGLFGPEALGLTGTLIVGMIVVQFTLDARECLMPFVLNGLQVAGLRNVPAGRVGGAGAAAFLAAVLAGVGFGLWVDYNYGLRRSENFPLRTAPKRPFDTLAQQFQKLEDAHAVETSRALTPLQRLTHMSPNPACLFWLGFGAVGVVLLYAARLRFPWWPLHPMIFVFWGTWAMMACVWSFLLGWLVNRVLARMPVPRYRVRAVMVGIIAGDLLGGLLWMVVGAIYFFLKQLPPPRYLVFPGG